MNTETPHHGGHEWIHSETIDPHRHICDEEWVCESGDLQMRIYHSIPCDDGEFWLAEISNGHEPEKGGYRVCGVMVDDFDTARTWCEATLPIAKVILRDTVEAKYCTADELSYDRGFGEGMRFQKNRMRVRGFLWTAWFSFWFGFEGVCLAVSDRIRGSGGGI